MAAKDITGTAPSHVAIIMDGNGRWATSRGWPRLVGHRRGAERVRGIVEAAPGLGIRYLTLYAFSTENWKRSTEEVIGLMTIFARYIQSEAERLSAEGVRLRFIGGRERLDKKLQKLMAGIEERTAGNDRLHLTVAINYGGRDELSRAAQRIARDVAAGKLSADEVDEDALADRLDTHDLPDPDLVIRTSGETRISNYLLWQSAYAEYEFTDTLWPDFTPAELGSILSRFHGRERRYGGALQA
ncbi:Ditrans,polycis-undecaprenyl-diphosphate synthase ((2E,6E)-farnesyl-diphosphate specific) [Defluviimonas aquaemixtae]|uniref:Isoprenyl transferase n=1 Tax=Albidovulum aquaemixtae TaxID=1542388 RepID=A0A2R8B5R3_9RHOB|nr:polyprenyl diphosphate synthase [Defluviimonas aquaemixtae]SPH17981.1 Ditrans,polycis-undecaprenyl-diphosphate synthase ((2E,6E)-farnesyl-diphosphate specific) [Defluviimonas aquaemixtae]